MKHLDLHPKAAISARKRTAMGGAVTLATLTVGLVLLVVRASIDFGTRAEEVRMDEIDRGDTFRLSFDVSFLDVNSCNSMFRVELLDSLQRSVDHDDSGFYATFWNKECRVRGVLNAPVGKGTFRVYPTLFNVEYIHGNHRVNAISAGDSLPSVHYASTVLKTDSARTETVGFWTYFINLVPTSSNGVDGFQLAATRNFVDLKNANHIRGSIFFHYEASPVRMYLDNRMTLSKFLHFLARGLGILSGLFAFVGISRDVSLHLYGRSGKRKKQSNLVM